jgi:hypothetical protein
MYALKNKLWLMLHARQLRGYADDCVLGSYNFDYKPYLQKPMAASKQKAIHGATALQFNTGNVTSN